MRDVVRIEIDAPLEEVARRFTDPTLSEKWMEDTRYEPLGGEQGAPGSTYRLTFGGGRMTFTATVISRDLPNEQRLLLESPSADVSIRAGFVALSPQRTLLVSEEHFEFKGFFSKAFAWLAGRSIRNAHRRQMESFKRFAES